MYYKKKIKKLSYRPFSHKILGMESKNFDDDEERADNAESHEDLGSHDVATGVVLRCDEGESSLVKLGNVFKMWEDPEYSGDPFAVFDWRSGMMDSLKQGDTRGIRRATLPAVQAEVVRIALEGKSEQTRLSAAQFILGQEGEGSVQKINSTLSFDKLPANQLITMIKSKMLSIKKLNPEFNIDGVIQQTIPALAGGVSDREDCKDREDYKIEGRQ